MKLLVFAHTPPPLHGQSAMVATLVEGLRGDPEIELTHVNPRLSRDSADIGRWRPGKALALVRSALRACAYGIRNRDAVFYYVPAPAKRGALYRDLVVMALCRPFFRRLVLHWHAVGLGEWLLSQALAIERVVSRWLLGHADLAIVLAPELAADAAVFKPRRLCVVANSVPDHSVPPQTRRGPADVSRVLFIGLCSREKGAFAAIDGIVLADKLAPGAFHLTMAGGFASHGEEREFRERLAPVSPALVTYAGFADERQKEQLFTRADIFCFPTHYRHEGQPLVLIEALSYNLPVITTRWRAIPSLLPARHVWFVDPEQPASIARALIEVRRNPPGDTTLRDHYLDRFSSGRHIEAMRTALLSADGSSGAGRPPR